MKRTIIVIALATLSIGAGACNSNATKDAKENTKPKGKYYCTMHPEVTSEKPGTCSKCGMDLAERDTTGK